MVHETNFSLRSASLAYLEKCSTLDPVMVSDVSSIPNGGNFFKPRGINSGLKCKCDLTMKNELE